MRDIAQRAREILLALEASNIGDKGLYAIEHIPLRQRGGGRSKSRPPTPSICRRFRPPVLKPGLDSRFAEQPQA
jgi:hypothetical protein